MLQVQSNREGPAAQGVVQLAISRTGHKGSLLL